MAIFGDIDLLVALRLNHKALLYAWHNQVEEMEVQDSSRADKKEFESHKRRLADSLIPPTLLIFEGKKHKFVKQSEIINKLAENSHKTKEAVGKEIKRRLDTLSYFGLITTKSRGNERKGKISKQGSQFIQGYAEKFEEELERLISKETKR